MDGTVEEQVNEIAKELGEEFDDIDPEKADLEIDPDYALVVWANRRTVSVRDANTLKLDMAANKVANPTHYDELRKAYNMACWLIVAIDRKYPAAKAMSLSIMKKQADNDRRMLE